MKAKRLTALITAFVMMCTLCGTMGYAYANEDIIGAYDYQIKNPYADVDWNTWTAYKAATHVHTVRSDGDIELKDMVEQYYQLGYQDLALTDHGTVNYSWTQEQARLAVFGYQAFVHGDVDEVSESRYAQITNGTDRNGNGMVEIPLGIELNGASTAKCHVNSYFADCGHGDLGMSASWPEDAVKKSQAAGGVCHINHVGEWTDGKKDITTYDTEFVTKFAKLFVDYSALVGMELVNTGDSRTKNDRFLYDQSLMRTAPQGVNIFGFCEDDAHSLNDCGRNAQYFVMPQNTAANVRTAMETGAFFACSKNAKTAAELGDGFKAEGEFPMVSNITVDEATDRISIAAIRANVVKMVADGKVIAQKTVTADNEVVTFDLNDYEDKIGSYVRFYVMGNGGICYAQPFLLTKTAFKTSTVQFLLPGADTTLTVKDAAGKVQEPVNADNYYKLAAGNYTYTAARNGYVTKTKAFTVTSADIAAGTQVKINVSLALDTSLVSVFFYVPETVYLAPTVSGNSTAFQYYLDRENKVDGALTQNAKDTAGGVFFYCDKATSVTVKAENAATVSNGSVDFVKGYTLQGNTLSTAVTAGATASPVAAGNGALITWTATYTLADGSAHTAYAFTYAYAPNANEAAAGMRQVHTYSTDVFNQGILYLAGANTVTGGTSACSKNFLTDTAPTANTGIAGWFTSATNGGAYFVNKSHSSNAGDTHTVDSGTATVYVDSARNTNLNQIPNLQVGMWQCDIEGDDAVRGSMTMTADGKTTALVTLNGVLGQVYQSGISYGNAKGYVGTKSVKISASTQTLRGKRQNNNNYNVYLKAQYVNKDALRCAVNNIVRESAGTTLTVSQLAAVSNAGYVLGNPTANSAQIATAYNQLCAF